MPSSDQPRITREAIHDAATRLHCAAFVYADPDHPVLVDDGHCWLLFLDDWGSGCRYGCDGEDMGLVSSLDQLEAILATVAAAYQELDDRTRELAVRHTAELRRLSGAEVYARAKAYALAQVDGT